MRTRFRRSVTISMRRIRHASELAGAADRIASIVARPASGLDQTERCGPSGLDVQSPSNEFYEADETSADISVDLVSALGSMLGVKFEFTTSSRLNHPSPQAVAAHRADATCASLDVIRYAAQNSNGSLGFVDQPYPDDDPHRAAFTKENRNSPRQSRRRGRPPWDPHQPARR